MAETDPLGGLNIDELFTDMDKAVRKGDWGNFGKAAEDLQIPSKDDTEQAIQTIREHQIFEERVLSNSFQSIDFNRDIRRLAHGFKQGFEKAKSEAAFGNYPLEDREHWSKASLESLTKTAEKKFNGLKIESGRAIPKTPQHQNLQRQTLRWEKILEIVRAASEIQE